MLTTEVTVESKGLAPEFLVPWTVAVLVLHKTLLATFPTLWAIWACISPKEERD